MKRDTPGLWLALLPPEALVRLERGGDFSKPHPDFPGTHALYFKCDNCQNVHWQHVAVRLDAVDGVLMVGHYRDHVSELGYMKRVDATPRVIRYLEGEVAREKVSYLGHRTLDGLTPAAFASEFRQELEDGVTMYLREIESSGKDPYRHFHPHPGSREALKALARAELNVRLQPEPLRA